MAIMLQGMTCNPIHIDVINENGTVIAPSGIVTPAMKRGLVITNRSTRLEVTAFEIAELVCLKICVYFGQQKRRRHTGSFVLSLSPSDDINAVYRIPY